ncbi:hypothetical protein BgiBS90_034201, partial [Biomphalaria glabrata]
QTDLIRVKEHPGQSSEYPEPHRHNELPKSLDHAKHQDFYRHRQSGRRSIDQTKAQEIPAIPEDLKYQETSKSDIITPSLSYYESPKAVISCLVMYKPVQPVSSVASWKFGKKSYIPVITYSKAPSKRKFQILQQRRLWVEGYTNKYPPSCLPVSQSFRKTLWASVQEEYAMHSWFPNVPDGYDSYIVGNQDRELKFRMDNGPLLDTRPLHVICWSRYGQLLNEWVTGRVTACSRTPKNRRLKECTSRSCNKDIKVSRPSPKRYGFTFVRGNLHREPRGTPPHHMHADVFHNDKAIFPECSGKQFPYLLHIRVTGCGNNIRQIVHTLYKDAPFNGIHLRCVVAMNVVKNASHLRQVSQLIDSIQSGPILGTFRIAELSAVYWTFYSEIIGLFHAHYSVSTTITATTKVDTINNDLGRGEEVDYWLYQNVNNNSYYCELDPLSNLKSCKHFGSRKYRRCRTKSNSHTRWRVRKTRGILSRKLSWKKQQSTKAVQGECLLAVLQSLIEPSPDIEWPCPSEVSSSLTNSTKFPLFGRNNNSRRGDSDSRPWHQSDYSHCSSKEFQSVIDNTVDSSNLQARRKNRAQRPKPWKFPAATEPRKESAHVDSLQTGLDKNVSGIKSSLLGQFSGDTKHMFYDRRKCSEMKSKDVTEQFLFTSPKQFKYLNPDSNRPEVPDPSCYDTQISVTKERESTAKASVAKEHLTSRQLLNEDAVIMSNKLQDMKSNDYCTLTERSVLDTDQANQKRAGKVWKRQRSKGLLFISGDATAMSTADRFKSIPSKLDETETYWTSPTANEETTASFARDRKLRATKGFCSRNQMEPKISVELQKKVKALVDSYKEFLQAETGQKQATSELATNNNKSLRHEGSVCSRTRPSKLVPFCSNFHILDSSTCRSSAVPDNIRDSGSMLRSKCDELMCNTTACDDDQNPFQACKKKQHSKLPRRSSCKRTIKANEYQTNGAKPVNVERNSLFLQDDLNMNLSVETDVTKIEAAHVPRCFGQNSHGSTHLSPQAAALEREMLAGCCIENKAKKENLCANACHTNLFYEQSDKIIQENPSHHLNSTNSGSAARQTKVPPESEQRKMLLLHYNQDRWQDTSFQRKAVGVKKKANAETNRAAERNECNLSSLTRPRQGQVKKEDHSGGLASVNLRKHGDSHLNSEDGLYKVNRIGFMGEKNGAGALRPSTVKFKVYRKKSTLKSFKNSNKESSRRCSPISSVQVAPESVNTSSRTNRFLSRPSRWKNENRFNCSGSTKRNNSINVNNPIYSRFASPCNISKRLNDNSNKRTSNVDSNHWNQSCISKQSQIPFTRSKIPTRQAYLQNTKKSARNVHSDFKSKVTPSRLITGDRATPSFPLKSNVVQSESRLPTEPKSPSNKLPTNLGQPHKAATSAFKLGACAALSQALRPVNSSCVAAQKVVRLRADGFLGQNSEAQEKASTASQSRLKHCPASDHVSQTRINGQDKTEKRSEVPCTKITTHAVQSNAQKTLNYLKGSCSIENVESLLLVTASSPAKKTEDGRWKKSTTSSEQGSWLSSMSSVSRYSSTISSETSAVSERTNGSSPTSQVSVEFESAMHSKTIRVDSVSSVSSKTSSWNDTSTRAPSFVIKNPRRRSRRLRDVHHLTRRHVVLTSSESSCPMFSAGSNMFASLNCPHGSEDNVSSLSTMRSIPELPYNFLSTDDLNQTTTRDDQNSQTMFHAKRNVAKGKRDYNFSNRQLWRTSSEPNMTTSSMSRTLTRTTKSFTVVLSHSSWETVTNSTRYSSYISSSCETYTTCNTNRQAKKRKSQTLLEKSIKKERKESGQKDGIIPISLRSATRMNSSQNKPENCKGRIKKSAIIYSPRSAAANVRHKAFNCKKYTTFKPKKPAACIEKTSDSRQTHKESDRKVKAAHSSDKPQDTVQREKADEASPRVFTGFQSILNFWESREGFGIANAFHKMFGGVRQAGDGVKKETGNSVLKEVDSDVTTFHSVSESQKMDQLQVDDLLPKASQKRLIWKRDFILPAHHVTNTSKKTHKKSTRSKDIVLPQRDTRENKVLTFNRANTIHRSKDRHRKETPSQTWSKHVPRNHNTQDKKVIVLPIKVPGSHGATKPKDDFSLRDSWREVDSMSPIYKDTIEPSALREHVVMTRETKRNENDLLNQNDRVNQNDLVIFDHENSISNVNTGKLEKRKKRETQQDANAEEEIELTNAAQNTTQEPCEYQDMTVYSCVQGDSLKLDKHISPWTCVLNLEQTDQQTNTNDKSPGRMRNVASENREEILALASPNSTKTASEKLCRSRSLVHEDQIPALDVDRETFFRRNFLPSNRRDSKGLKRHARRHFGYSDQPHGNTDSHADKKRLRRTTKYKLNSTSQCDANKTLQQRNNDSYTDARNLEMTVFPGKGLNELFQSGEPNDALRDKQSLKLPSEEAKFKAIISPLTAGRKPPICSARAMTCSTHKQPDSPMKILEDFSKLKFGAGSQHMKLKDRRTACYNKIRSKLKQLMLNAESLGVVAESGSSEKDASQRADTDSKHMQGVGHQGRQLVINKIGRMLRKQQSKKLCYHGDVNVSVAGDRRINAWGKGSDSTQLLQASAQSKITKDGDPTKENPSYESFISLCTNDVLGLFDKMHSQNLESDSNPTQECGPDNFLLKNAEPFRETSLCRDGVVVYYSPRNVCWQKLENKVAGNSDVIIKSDYLLEKQGTLTEIPVTMAGSEKLNSSNRTCCVKGEDSSKDDFPDTSYVPLTQASTSENCNTKRFNHLIMENRNEKFQDKSLLVEGESKPMKRSTSEVPSSASTQTDAPSGEAKVAWLADMSVQSTTASRTDADSGQVKLVNTACQCPSKEEKLKANHTRQFLSYTASYADAESGEVKIVTTACQCPSKEERLNANPTSQSLSYKAEAELKDESCQCPSMEQLFPPLLRISRCASPKGLAEGMLDDKTPQNHPRTANLNKSKSPMKEATLEKAMDPHDVLVKDLYVLLLQKFTCNDDLKATHSQLRGREIHLPLNKKDPGYRETLRNLFSVLKESLTKQDLDFRLKQETNSSPATEIPPASLDKEENVRQALKPVTENCHEKTNLHSISPRSMNKAAELQGDHITPIARENKIASQMKTEPFENVERMFHLDDSTNKDLCCSEHSLESLRAKELTFLMECLASRKQESEPDENVYCGKTLRKHEKSPQKCITSTKISSIKSSPINNKASLKMGSIQSSPAQSKGSLKIGPMQSKADLKMGSIKRSPMQSKADIKIGSVKSSPMQINPKENVRINHSLTTTDRAASKNAQITKRHRDTSELANAKDFMARKQPQQVLVTMNQQQELSEDVKESRRNIYEPQLKVGLSPRYLQVDTLKKSTKKPVERASCLMNLFHSFSENLSEGTLSVCKSITELSEAGGTKAEDDIDVEYVISTGLDYNSDSSDKSVSVSNAISATLQHSSIGCSTRAHSMGDVYSFISDTHRHNGVASGTTRALKRSEGALHLLQAGQGLAANRQDQCTINDLAKKDFDCRAMPLECTGQVRNYLQIHRPGHKKETETRFNSCLPSQKFNKQVTPKVTQMKPDFSNNPSCIEETDAQKPNTRKQEYLIQSSEMDSCTSLPQDLDSCIDQTELKPHTEGDRSDEITYGKDHPDIFADHFVMNRNRFFMTSTSISSEPLTPANENVPEKHDHVTKQPGKELKTKRRSHYTSSHSRLLAVGDSPSFVITCSKQCLSTTEECFENNTQGSLERQKTQSTQFVKVNFESSAISRVHGSEEFSKLKPNGIRIPGMRRSKTSDEPPKHEKFERLTPEFEVGSGEKAFKVYRKTKKRNDRRICPRQTDHSHYKLDIEKTVNEDHQNEVKSAKKTAIEELAEHHPDKQSHPIDVHILTFGRYRTDRIDAQDERKGQKPIRHIELNSSGDRRNTAILEMQKSQGIIPLVVKKTHREKPLILETPFPNMSILREDCLPKSFTSKLPQYSSAELELRFQGMLKSTTRSSRRHQELCAWTISPIKKTPGSLQHQKIMSVSSVPARPVAHKPYLFQKMYLHRERKDRRRAHVEGLSHNEVHPSRSKLNKKSLGTRSSAPPLFLNNFTFANNAALRHKEADIVAEFDLNSSNVQEHVSQPEGMNKLRDSKERTLFSTAAEPRRKEFEIRSTHKIDKNKTEGKKDADQEVASNECKETCLRTGDKLEHRSGSVKMKTDSPSLIKAKETRKIPCKAHRLKKKKPQGVSEIKLVPEMGENSTLDSVGRYRDVEIILGKDIPYEEFATSFVSGIHHQLNHTQASEEDRNDPLKCEVQLVIDKIFGNEPDVRFQDKVKSFAKETSLHVHVPSGRPKEARHDAKSSKALISQDYTVELNTCSSHGGREAGYPFQTRGCSRLNQKQTFCRQPIRNRARKENAENCQGDGLTKTEGLTDKLISRHILGVSERNSLNKVTDSIVNKTHRLQCLEKPNWQSGYNTATKSISDSVISVPSPTPHTARKVPHHHLINKLHVKDNKERYVASSSKTSLRKSRKAVLADVNTKKDINQPVGSVGGLGGTKFRPFLRKIPLELFTISKPDNYTLDKVTKVNNTLANIISSPFYVQNRINNEKDFEPNDQVKLVDKQVAGAMSKPEAHPTKPLLTKASTLSRHEKMPEDKSKNISDGKAHTKNDQCQRANQMKNKRPGDSHHSSLAVKSSKRLYDVLLEKERERFEPEIVPVAKVLEKKQPVKTFNSRNERICRKNPEEISKPEVLVSQRYVPNLIPFAESTTSSDKTTTVDSRTQAASSELPSLIETQMKQELPICGRTSDFKGISEENTVCNVGDSYDGSLETTQEEHIPKTSDVGNLCSLQKQHREDQVLPEQGRSALSPLPPDKVSQITQIIQDIIHKNLLKQNLSEIPKPEGPAAPQVSAGGPTLAKDSEEKTDSHLACTISIPPIFSESLQHKSETKTNTNIDVQEVSSKKTSTLSDAVSQMHSKTLDNALVPPDPTHTRGSDKDAVQLKHSLGKGNSLQESSEKDSITKEKPSGKCLQLSDVNKVAYDPHKETHTTQVATTELKDTPSSDGTSNEMAEDQTQDTPTQSNSLKLQDKTPACSKDAKETEYCTVSSQCETCHVVMTEEPDNSEIQIPREFKLKAPCSFYTEASNVSVTLDPFNKSGEQKKYVMLTVPRVGAAPQYDLIVEANTDDEGPPKIVAENGYVSVSFGKVTPCEAAEEESALEDNDTPVMGNSNIAESTVEEQLAESPKAQSDIDDNTAPRLFLGSCPGPKESPDVPARSLYTNLNENLHFHKLPGSPETLYTPQSSTPIFEKLKGTHHSKPSHVSPLRANTTYTGFTTDAAKMETDYTYNINTPRRDSYATSVARQSDSPSPYSTLKYEEHYKPRSSRFNDTQPLTPLKTTSLLQSEPPGLRSFLQRQDEWFNSMGVPESSTKWHSQTEANETQFAKDSSVLQDRNNVTEPGPGRQKTKDILIERSGTTSTADDRSRPVDGSSVRGRPMNDEVNKSIYDDHAIRKKCSDPDMSRTQAAPSGLSRLYVRETGKDNLSYIGISRGETRDNIDTAPSRHSPLLRTTDIDRGQFNTALDSSNIRGIVHEIDRTFQRNIPERAAFVRESALGRGRTKDGSFDRAYLNDKDSLQNKGITRTHTRNVEGTYVKDNTIDNSQIRDMGKESILERNSIIDRAQPRELGLTKTFVRDATIDRNYLTCTAVDRSIVSETHPARLGTTVNDVNNIYIREADTIKPTASYLSGTGRYPLSTSPDLSTFTSRSNYLSTGTIQASSQQMSGSGQTDNAHPSLPSQETPLKYSLAIRINAPTKFQSHLQREVLAEPFRSSSVDSDIQLKPQYPLKSFDPRTNKHEFWKRPFAKNELSSHDKFIPKKRFTEIFSGDSVTVNTASKTGIPKNILPDYQAFSASRENSSPEDSRIRDRGRQFATLQSRDKRGRRLYNESSLSDDCSELESPNRRLEIIGAATKGFNRAWAGKSLTEKRVVKRDSSGESTASEDNLSYDSVSLNQKSSEDFFRQKKVSSETDDILSDGFNQGRISLKEKEHRVLSRLVGSNVSHQVGAHRSSSQTEKFLSSSRPVSSPDPSRHFFERPKDFQAAGEEAGKITFNERAHFGAAKGNESRSISREFSDSEVSSPDKAYFVRKPYLKRLERTSYRDTALNRIPYHDNLHVDSERIARESRYNDVENKTEKQTSHMPLSDYSSEDMSPRTYPKQRYQLTTATEKNANQSDSEDNISSDSEKASSENSEVDLRSRFSPTRIGVRAIDCPLNTLIHQRDSPTYNSYGRSEVSTNASYKIGKSRDTASPSPNGSDGNASSPRRTPHSSLASSKSPRAGLYRVRFSDEVQQFDIPHVNKEYSRMKRRAPHSRCFEEKHFNHRPEARLDTRDLSHSHNEESPDEQPPECSDKDNAPLKTWHPNPPITKIPDPNTEDKDPSHFQEPEEGNGEPTETRAPSNKTMKKRHSSLHREKGESTSQGHDWVDSGYSTISTPNDFSGISEWDIAIQKKLEM